MPTFKLQAQMHEDGYGATAYAMPEMTGFHSANIIGARMAGQAEDNRDWLSARVVSIRSRGCNTPQQIQR
jgi:hypothetical protein